MSKQSEKNQDQPRQVERAATWKQCKALSSMIAKRTRDNGGIKLILPSVIANRNYHIKDVSDWIDKMIKDVKFIPESLPLDEMVKESDKIKKDQDIKFSTNIKKDKSSSNVDSSLEERVRELESQVKMLIQLMK